MKKSWFQHYPMSEVEANQLIFRYKSRGIVAEKNLTGDPRFYVVSAFLPVSKSPPRPSKWFQNRMWSQMS